MIEKATPVRISKKIVDATFPGAARIEVWDRELRGFGLRVEPTGTKTYIVKYRKRGLGRTVSKSTYKLGRHGEMTPDEARSRAKALLGRVATGDDPAEELREARQEHVRKRAGLTVEALAKLFMTEHVELKRKDHTVSNYASLFRKHVNPGIGSILAAELKRTDVIRLQSSLSKKSKMANKVVAVISSMYGFAGKREYVPEGLNPTRGIERYREEGRERYLTSDELQRLGQALDEAETIGLPWDIDWANPNSKHVPKEWKGQREKLDAHAVAALRLLLLTGARLREILHLKWRYVDLERGLLLLPDSKTGRKTIVLSAAAMNILSSFAQKDRERIAKSREAFVIKGQLDDRPRADLKKPWDAIRRRAGLEDVRLHDLRHTFASIGAGSSLGLPIVGKLLGHSQPQTTARYAHLDADPLRRATDIIGDHITKAMNAR